MFGIVKKRKENARTQVILILELDEILRAFMTGAKNGGFRLLRQKGLNACPNREASESTRSKTL